MALSTYEAFASVYDAQTADYDHDRWLSELERLGVEHGLVGKRVLDVACGTGKSFLPLVERGYDVTACDLSPSMLRVARTRLPDPDRAFVADMRSLPAAGGVDLVTCLDDAVNYLLEPHDLQAALASMRSVLRPGGLLLFDTNTLSTYRTAFASDSVFEHGEHVFCWRGESSPHAAPGAIHAATVEVFTRTTADRWRRTSGRHVQRHHSRGAIEDCLARVGLLLRAVRGQSPGARLYRIADEERHSKLVFVAQRPQGGPMIFKP